MEQLNAARNKGLRFAAYKAVVKVLEDITGDFRVERYPLGKFDNIIKLRYPERDKDNYSGSNPVIRAERRRAWIPVGTEAAETTPSSFGAQLENERCPPSFLEYENIASCFTRGRPDLERPVEIAALRELSFVTRAFPRVSPTMI